LAIGELTFPRVQLLALEDGKFTVKKSLGTDFTFPRPRAPIALSPDSKHLV
jgi:hypothetical protein